MIGRADYVHKVFGKRLTGPRQLRRELLVHHCHDQGHIFKRRKILNQTRRFDHEFYIKLLWFRHPPVFRHHHHFAAVHGHGSFRMTSGIKCADSFQDHEFRWRARCQKSRPSCHRCRNGRCADLDCWCFGRHLQKNRPTCQIKFTCPLLKTENRIRAESR